MVPIRFNTLMSKSPVAEEIRRRFIGEVPGETPLPSLRVVLYSHDTMGIGHMRRNLLIAQKIRQQFPSASVLVIAGAREAAIFSQQAGIDCLTLPSFRKEPNGTYSSRHLKMSADDVLDFRSETILAAMHNFRPDLFIVDKIPSGAGGELLPTLNWLRSSNNCHCVLGLREILDAADVVRQEWNDTHAFEIIRHHFDAIWIYGDPMVFDAPREYSFPDDIRERVRFTGYLDTCMRLEQNREFVNPFGNQDYVLCMVGGGQDGEAIATTFVEAARRTERQCLLLTGPYMPDSATRRVVESAASVARLRVMSFVSEADALVRNATHVVSMGGYNTLAAILSWHKHSLIVPRVTPRTEQLIRAERLAKLGYVSMIHPDNLTPHQLGNWMTQPERKRPGPATHLDLNGLDRICSLISSRFPVHCSITPV